MLSIINQEAESDAFLVRATLKVINQIII
jgi:hypothetical protein